MTDWVVDASLTLMVLPVAVLIAEQVLHTLYRAYDELNRGECVFAVYNILQIASVVIALALKQPPLVVAACYLVVPLLFAVGLFYDLRSRRPQLRFRVRAPQKGELREAVPPSLLYFMFPLSNALVQNGTVLLFGLLNVGPAMLVGYTAYRTFAGLTRQAANQFAVGGGIEMARQHAIGENEICQRLYGHTGRIVTALVGLFAGISIPVSGPFISIWTRGEVASAPMLLGFFLAGIFLAGPGQAAMMLLKYSNVPRPCAAAWAGHSVGGLILCLLFVPTLGVAGAALAFMISEAAAMSVFLPLVVQRTFGFGAAAFWARSYATGLAAFAVSYTVGEFIFSFGGEGGLVVILLKVALWGAAVLPAVGLIILTPAQRSALLARFSRRRGIASLF